MGFSLLLHSPESRSLTYWRLPGLCSRPSGVWLESLRSPVGGAHVLWLTVPRGRLPAVFCSLAHLAALVLRRGWVGAVLLLLER